ncbi:MAG: signal peptidase II, partial [Clostridia bacterium]|nr:signal peptidase II [Clostridia bacterium]
MVYVLAIVVAALFLAADQLSKHYVVANFALAETKRAIDGLFDFTYIHNKGGAW